MGKKIKTKKFPCQYCKGSGIIETGELQDGIQISPDIECGNCLGEGMIEVGGKVHMEHLAFRIGCDILWQPGKNVGKGIDYKRIVRVGRKALKLVSAFNALEEKE